MATPIANGKEFRSSTTRRNDDDPKRDNKMTDVFTMSAHQVDKTQKVTATLDLSQKPKGKFAAAGMQNFAEILNLIKKYVADSYPVAMDMMV